MIKIIVPGAKPDMTKRFEYPTCGCVFDADERDYSEGFYLIRKFYCAVCPMCGEVATRREPNG